MDPAEFAAKWTGSKRSERAASQEHFIDLCRMLGVPTPNEADPSGETYAFEKGAEKTGGGGGFADVWKRGYFGWEYKGKKKDLKVAYDQLLLYREALENPPLLVVCDLDRFQVHTNFTGTAKRVHEFSLADLATAPKEPLAVLRAVMLSPEDLRPDQTREQLTEEAARHFAAIATSLRDKGHDPDKVAHILTKLLFCLYAEDSGLLPQGLMGRLTAAAIRDPAGFDGALADLFGKMSEGGGLFGTDRVQWFNGGLFDGPDTLPLGIEEIAVLGIVAGLDWSQIEPAIFGTLFERGLDPGKRSQLGAHYTDKESIGVLVEAVVMRPLRREFEEMKAQVQALLDAGRKAHPAPGRQRSRLKSDPARPWEAFLDRLRSVTVLDPACGSGNFLYVALQSLKDLEREAAFWGSEKLGVPMQTPQVSPAAVRGIELNHYAAELARVTIWIGEIQWMLQNGFAYLRDPVLRPLESIRTMDAVLDTSKEAPREPEWPDAEFIVGNPPFLGSRFLRRELGDEYVDNLFEVYDGRVPRGADFVTYWFEKARAMIEAGRLRRAGLLGTQGIRGGESRRVLERIKETGDIFMAVSDTEWVLEGAAVNISFVAFDDGSEGERELDRRPVAAINADLTSGLDLTAVRPLKENAGIAFQGPVKVGPFDLPGSLAESMLSAPNPDGRENSDVLRPWVNGTDITRRPRGMWIVDFEDMTEAEAALYEAPFEYVRKHVQPIRVSNRRERRRRMWWQHGETVPGLRGALNGLTRFIVTSRVSKYRIFAWVPPNTIPDSAVVAIARDDDYTFGALQCRVHQLWAFRMGTQLEDRPRYTPRTTFEPFPFPRPTDEQRSKIADAARELVQLRDGWLRAREGRTLTGLYNEVPAWLKHVHERLDALVLDAYGWPHDIGEEELLRRLFDLNAERSATTLVPAN